MECEDIMCNCYHEDVSMYNVTNVLLRKFLTFFSKDCYIIISFISMICIIINKIRNVKITSAKIFEIKGIMYRNSNFFDNTSN